MSKNIWSSNLSWILLALFIGIGTGIGVRLFIIYAFFDGHIIENKWAMVIVSLLVPIIIGMIISSMIVATIYASYFGEKLLRFARNKDFDQVEKLLNSRNIQLSKVDNNGKTALYYAYESNNNAIVEDASP